MVNPALESSVAKLELLLQEELGLVDGFRRAYEEAPDSLRSGLRLCLSFHRRCIRHLRALIEMAGGSGEDGDDFEIVEAFDEARSSRMAN